MRAIDIFSGAGGFTLGAQMAGAKVLWAANHWPAAVAAHLENHPHTTHVCQDVHQAAWAEVPEHDLLLASPCCQGHYQGHRRNQRYDESRCTAWAVVSAVEVCRPPFAIIENVPGFLLWPLFPSWEDALKRLGYSLSFNVLNAADAGVPQDRVRLFIIASRSRCPTRIEIPAAPRRSASEIIEWHQHNWSPVNRPGRSLKTLDRVKRGRAEFGERFVMPYYSSGSGKTGRSLERPLGTVTTRARWAIVDQDRMRMLAPSEVARAMSFPASYKLPRNIKMANHLLGNAVCPLQGKAVIEALLKAS